MKKYLKLFFVLIPLYILYEFFIHDIRMLKEAYLIKSNFENNYEQFNSFSKDFETFPNISLNFGEEGYVEIETRGFVLYDYNLGIELDSLNENDLIPWVGIDDSDAELRYRNYVYFVQDLEFTDAVLHVVTTDSLVFDFDKLWRISYRGHGTSIFNSIVYQASKLDTTTIKEIKTQLRKRNCFGYDRYDDNLILHFRSSKGMMFDSYSYCELEDPSTLPEFLEKSFDYGKLNQNTYWFYNDPWGTISYDPWLLFYNRDI